MNKQQTAVEWFIDKLSNYDSKIIELFEKEIKQANKMHEQQIMDAWWNGHDIRGESGLVHVPETIAEQYYNETFKQTP